MPLSMQKRLESLARWSALALFGVCVLVLIVIIEGSRVPHPPNRGNVDSFFQPHFVQAIGVMAFAYVMHHNAFLIYASLKDTSMKKFAKVTHLSVVVAATMSIALGVGGFYPFGHETKDDVLDNFADDNSAANAARFFFALAIMLTYPIECFVAREVIENYFFSEQQP